MHEDEKLPLTEHLEALRRRLIRCCVAISVSTCFSYFFKEKIFAILSQPLINVMPQGSTLIFTGLTDAFFIFIKASVLSGIILAIPLIFYEFLMFFVPELYQKRKKMILPVIIISTLFFIGGVLFAYFLVFPYGFKFLLGFASDTIHPLPSISEYLDFSAKIMLAFGLIFETPIIITVLAWMGVVTTDFLKKNRKYALILIWIIAAILTPTPDIFNQALMAVPLMLLYEVSIFGAHIFGRERKEPLSPESGDTQL